MGGEGCFKSMLPIMLNIYDCSRDISMPFSYITTFPQEQNKLKYQIF